MNSVVEWLNRLNEKHNDMKDIIGLTLVVGRESFLGAQYTYVGKYTADMDACRWNKKKPGETYEQVRFYFIGKLPKCIKKRSKTCFTHEGRTLYVSSYYQTTPVEEAFKEFHPFGQTFMLGIWPTEQFGEEIDHYEPKKYTRVPIELIPWHVCEDTDEMDRPLKPEMVTCGGCHRSWCERCCPTPVSLCPFCNGDEDRGKANQISILQRCELIPTP